MEISGRTLLYVVGGFILLLLGVVVFGAIKKHSYDARMVELQNQIAARDVTIEVSKGVYTKLTLQLHNVEDALNQKDEQVKSLEAELKKRKEELLTATTIAANWKKAYEAEVKAKQTEVPGTNPGDPTRTKVEFDKDFGYIGVKGYTLTNPAMAWVHVQQNRPLKITLAVSQDKEKKWHTYATSSEENVGVDVEVTAVNPYLLQPKWYENIGLSVALGGGTNAQGGAALIGLGLDYKIKQFTVGPGVWLGISDRVDKYYGINFSWRPFQKN